jgi:hypothetical protein
MPAARSPRPKPTATSAPKTAPSHHDEAGDRAAARSEAASRAEHRIIDGYPMGQPILVGHHSECRHRRDLERADSYRRRARDEQDKAGYHAGRAAAAERYQAGRESVPVTLRRIAGLEAEARQVQRRSTPPTSS